MSPLLLPHCWSLVFWCHLIWSFARLVKHIIRWNTQAMIQNRQQYPLNSGLSIMLIGLVHPPCIFFMVSYPSYNVTVPCHRMNYRFFGAQLAATTAETTCSHQTVIVSSTEPGETHNPDESIAEKSWLHKSTSWKIMVVLWISHDHDHLVKIIQKLINQRMKKNILWRWSLAGSPMVRCQQMSQLIIGTHLPGDRSSSCITRLPTK